MPYLYVPDQDVAVVQRLLVRLLDERDGADLPEPEDHYMPEEELEEDETERDAELPLHYEQDEDLEWVDRSWAAITEPARRCCVEVAKLDDWERITGDELARRADVSNRLGPDVGPAMMSVVIQADKYHLPSLIEKQRDSKLGRTVYFMNPRVAARIRQLAGLA
jgi:hypothetical protein